MVSACGKHSKNKSKPVQEVAPVTITPKEEEFIKDVQVEFKLPEASVEEIKVEFEKTEDPYTKSNIMFCAGAGAATVIEMASFTCRSFKGDRITMELYGAGISFSVHADLMVLYAKKGSRHLKEGTYTVGLSALHLGLGLMGLRIMNDNSSINWRMRGITLGLGLDNSIGRMVVKKY